ALRYGSIPSVRRTGGLSETVRDYARDPAGGTGFTFEENHAKQLLGALRAALSVYRVPPRWNELQRRAMAAEFSWDQPVREYEQMYLEARERRAARMPAAAA